MIDTFTCINSAFLPSYKMPRTLPVGTLLLFGLVMLLCGLKCGILLFYSELYPLRDLFRCQTMNAIQTSHPCSVLSAYPYTQTTVSLNWWIRGRTKLSPNSAWVTFKQTTRKKWRNVPALIRQRERSNRLTETSRCVHVHLINSNLCKCWLRFKIHGPSSNTCSFNTALPAHETVI